MFICAEFGLTLPQTQESPISDYFLYCTGTNSSLSDADVTMKPLNQFQWARAVVIISTTQGKYIVKCWRIY